jgi:transcriptional regulator with XRE-family HTH domain
MRKRYSRHMAKRSISTVLLEEVGIRLRMVRAVVGQGQAEWARALRITPQLLNKWEQGVRQPNADRLIAMCEATGCTMDFIYRRHAGLDMKAEFKARLYALYPSSPYVVFFWPPAPPAQPDPQASPASPKCERRIRRKRSL